MKYIDAELLWKEIEKNKNTIDGMFTEGDDSVYDGENDAYNRVLRIINSLQQKQPVTTNTLTWKDIIDIEQILNQVRYEYNCGIGEESFGKEVLERFLEQRDELLEHSEDDVRNEDAQDKVEEKPRYCVPRYWDGQYDQSELFKEQPVEGRLEMAARHVWESWNGGTMDDVRRDMKALGNVLNSRKEE